MLAIAVVTAGCAEDAPRGSLLLLSVDTLRPDHLGCYGSPEARTPTWDRLARTGTQFRWAVTSAPFTLPSHATMLTGEYPYRHLARRNDTRRFDPEGPTLAEALGEHGLRTGAVTASVVLDSSTELDRGFEHFEWQDHEGQAERRATDVVAAAWEWLREIPVDDAYFLFVHLYDPHDPYDPPSPWSHVSGNRYDGEIAYADRALGRFLRQLEGAGRLERTLVIALADHGEAFGEHGENGHGFFIYETTLRVPLVIGGGEFLDGGVRSDLARTVDLFPTVLREFGIREYEGRSGRPLQVGVAHSPESYAETFYAALTLDDVSDLRSLRKGRWKYVRAPREELYDLEADPGETVNLLAKSPGRAEDLRDRMSALLGDDLTRPAGLVEREVIDDGRVEQLRALGYVAGGRTSARPLSALRDPKDLVGIPDLLDRVGPLAARSRWDEALLLLDDVLAKDPRNAVALRWKAQHWFQRSEPDKGLAVYERVLEAYPEAAAIWRDYGSELLRLGRPEAARRALRKAVNLDGDVPSARLRLARAAWRSERPRVAWKELKILLTRNPDHVGARRLAREIEKAGGPPLLPDDEPSSGRE